VDVTLQCEVGFLSVQGQKKPYVVDCLPTRKGAELSPERDRHDRKMMEEAGARAEHKKRQLALEAQTSRQPASIWCPSSISYHLAASNTVAIEPNKVPTETRLHESERKRPTLTLQDVPISMVQLSSNLDIETTETHTYKSPLQQPYTPSPRQSRREESFYGHHEGAITDLDALMNPTADVMNGTTCSPASLQDGHEAGRGGCKEASTFRSRVAKLQVQMETLDLATLMNKATIALRR
jgi:hypothetical protein